MTQLTQRQDSILRMFAIMDTVKYSGGDWDDALAARVDAIPDLIKLPGITGEEYYTIQEAHACPRMVSDLLADLHGEVEGLVSIDQSILDKEIQDEIDTLEKIIEALKMMKVHQGALKDKYWGSSAFAHLDAIDGVTHDQTDYQFKDDFTGIDITTEMVRISYTIDIRQ